MIKNNASIKNLNVGYAKAGQRPSAILHNQKGQAMVEFFAAMLVLIPLFWAIITMGKFFDFENSGRQAARYINWEQTVYQGNAVFNANVNGQTTRDRFLRDPLGGVDPNINQAVVNPLWSMPALIRPNGEYYIIDPNAAVPIARNTLFAMPLVSPAAPASRFNGNTLIRRITLSIPFDDLPWAMSNYPENDFTADNANRLVRIRYAAAMLPDTFISNTEDDIFGNMPVAQTSTPLNLATNEPVLGVINIIGNIVSPVLSSYPFAEIVDYPFLTFFNTNTDSAVLPPSRLQ